MDDILTDKDRLLYEGSIRKSGAAMFAELASGYINYNVFKTNALLAKNEANQIELNAKERANALREQYNAQIGNSISSMTSRGGKVSSGNLRDNLENSSIALGKDINQMQKNAESSARLKRLEASNSKRNAITSVVGSLDKAINYYSQNKKYRDTLQPYIDNKTKK